MVNERHQRIVYERNCRRPQGRRLRAGEERGRVLLGLQDVLRRRRNKPRGEDARGQVLRVRGESTTESVSVEASQLEMSQLIIMNVISGELECERVHAAVPLWRILRISEAEGARVQEHHLDRRVRRPKAQSQDRQLHPHLLRCRHGTEVVSCHAGLTISLEGLHVFC